MFNRREGEAEEGKHLPISKSLYKTQLHPTLPSLNRGKGRFGRLSFEWARKGWITENLFFEWKKVVLEGVA